MCQNGTDIPMTKLKQFHNKSYSKPPLGSSRKDVWFALLKGLDSFSVAFQCNRPLWDISWMITASDQLAGSDPWPLNRYACPGVVEGACASDVATSISMRKADVKSIEKWFFFWFRGNFPSQDLKGLGQHLCNQNYGPRIKVHIARIGWWISRWPEIEALFDLWTWGPSLWPLETLEEECDYYPGNKDSTDNGHPVRFILCIHFARPWTSMLWRYGAGAGTYGHP